MSKGSLVEKARALLAKYEEEEAARRARNNLRDSKEQNAKKGNRKRQKRSKSRKPLKEPIKDKNYFEAIIVKLNRRLGELRKDTSKIVNDHHRLLTELVMVEQDHVDEEVYLNKQIKIRNEKISITKSKILKVKDDREALKLLSLERIKDLQDEYAETEEKLKQEKHTSNLLLRAKRSTQMQRNGVFEELEDRAKVLQHEEAHLRELQKHECADMMTIRLKDNLIRNIDLSLNRFVDDLIQSEEIRYGDFVERLVYENTKLHIQLDNLAIRSMKLITKREKQLTKHKEIMVEHELVTDMVQHLETLTINKQKVIEDIEIQSQRMKAELVQVINFRILYDALRLEYSHALTPLESTSYSTSSNVNSYLADREKLLSQLSKENENINELIALQRIEIEHRQRSLEYLNSVVKENLKLIQKKDKTLKNLQGKTFNVKDANSLEDLENLSKSARMVLFSKLLHMLFDEDELGYAQDEIPVTWRRCYNPKEQAKERLWNYQHRFMDKSIKPRLICERKPVGVIPMPPSDAENTSRLKVTSSFYFSPDCSACGDVSRKIPLSSQFIRSAATFA